MIYWSKIVFFRSKILHCYSEHVLVVRNRLPAVDISKLPLLEREQLVQPVVELHLGVKHDGHAVIQGVERDHKLVTRVAGVEFPIDIEALFEDDGAFWGCFGFPFALVVIILQSGGTGGSGAGQDKPLLLVGLELLEGGRPDHRSILHQDPGVPRRTFLLKNRNKYITYMKTF